jgi:hypothetical protein
MTEAQRLIVFYEGAAPDDCGRYLEDVLDFNDAQLEYTHDFIQWLFPLRERSGANPDAPCLDDVAIAQFLERPELRHAMQRALNRMLSFYGLERQGDDIVKAPDFAKHAGWLTPGNHNHLRLTRMLKSLRLLGNEHEAKALYDCLSRIYDEEQGSGERNISERTFRFWHDAASVH